MRRIGRSLAVCTAGLLAAALVGSSWAADGTIRKLPLVELEIRPLQGSAERPPERLVLKDEIPAKVAFASDWDGVGRVGVELTARAEPAGSARSVRLQATLTLPGGRRIQTSRDALVDERGTILFELFRKNDRPFTLAIAATVSETWEVVRAPSVGEAVRFEIEVFRVDGQTKTSLERNILQSFENQTVLYEFRHGPKLTDEALTLRLTPVRVVGELVEIRINVEGRLGAGDDVTVIASDETLVVDRNRASPIRVVAGDPPAGYEFNLTPRF